MWGRNGRLDIAEKGTMLSCVFFVLLSDCVTSASAWSKFLINKFQASQNLIPVIN